MSAVHDNGLLGGFSHTIAGRAVAGRSQFEVIDPSTGAAFAWCPDASRNDLDDAVHAAGAAQRAWSRCGFDERRRHLCAFAAALRENSEYLSSLLTHEQGKPLSRAVNEIKRSAAALEILSSIEIEKDILRCDEEGIVELHYRPLGVVGAITPWNVPIVLAVPKIAQALYAGNTIVVKPSPYTPLTTLEIGRIARKIFPPGVLNVVAGGNALGQWLTEHPDVAKVSFTGSVATGKRVMRSAAETLKRVTLELGGNDAAIVLPDVVPEEIAQRLFWAAFNNCGQVCMAIKRLYVHASIYERLCAELANIARRVKVGNGFEEGVELGPVQNRMQFDRVSEILTDTRSLRGVRILAGGFPLDRPGYFVQPTIVTDIREGTRLVDEETFGPVLPVIRFTDVEDAIRRANATRFGLGGSIWTNDLDRGAALAEELEVGTTWVNRHLNSDMLIPFGGWKESGIGREYSIMGLKAYMEPQVVHLPASGRSRDNV